MASLDSFKCRKSFKVGAKTYEYYSLKAAERHGLAGISELPYSLKVVLENLLRNEDGRSVNERRHRGGRRLVGQPRQKTSTRSPSARRGC